MSLFLLGCMLVLVAAYLALPAIRERSLHASPVSSVGAFRRGLDALAGPGQQSGAGGAYEMRGVGGGRQVLMPQRAETAGFEYTVPGGPVRALSSSSTAAERRRRVQVALGGLTGVFVLAGIFAHMLWAVAFLCLLLFLAYLALAVEAERREAERAFRGRLPLRAVGGTAARPASPLPARPRHLPRALQQGPDAERRVAAGGR